MHQCTDCEWQLSVAESLLPCPGCGGLNRLIISVDIGEASEPSPPLLLSSHSFAPEWFADAVHEAKHAPHASVHDARSSKRREIVSAACCVEAYLLEWTYHDLLVRDANRLNAYFPIGESPGISDRIKNVCKKLYDDKFLQKKLDFGGLDQWGKLVHFRNCLIHARASRPESNVSGDPKPEPSMRDLDGMPHGWAVKTIITVIERLHSAAGTKPPAWLTFAN